MKLRRLFFTFLISLAAFQFCFSQESEKNLVLLESFTKPNCEELLAHLDRFTGEINNKLNSVGYIVIYGGLNSIENNFYERYLNFHIKLRKLNGNRFRVITTKGNQELKIELWTSINGKKPEVLESNFGYDLPQTNKRHYFVEESGEIINFDGERQFVGDCPACCIETLDLNLLSKFLQANPKLNAHITVYNKTTSGRANKLIKLISDTAVKDYKIPRNRLKIIYGGNKAGAYIWNKNMSSLTVWLVPQKKK